MVAPEHDSFPPIPIELLQPLHTLLLLNEVMHPKIKIKSVAYSLKEQH